MTYKEAIEQLKSINNFDSLCQESHEALDIAIIAIKVLEQYSEKPIHKYNNSWEEDWYINE